MELRNLLLAKRLHCGQIEGNATDAFMMQAHLYAQPSVGTAYIEHGRILAEVKLVGQCNEVAGLYTGHCIYKLAQFCVVCIKLGEVFHVATFLVLAFILYLAAAKPVSKSVPELGEPVVRH